ncbi:MAG: TetR/AcrR family transcriptional regulator [Microbacteriaceae bacterium]
MTVVDSDPTLQRAPWAKQRILDTANELFYNEGIRVVGIDRLISVSSVTKATFYKHYGSKDTLILKYIRARHEAMRIELTKTIDGTPDPEAALRTIVAEIAGRIVQPGFRGCAFLHAAAEFPDPMHPVRQVVSTHREWYTDVIANLFSELGHPIPGDAADEYLLAIDGAQAGGYAGDPIAATTSLQRAVDRILIDTSR